jgi:hypothetical protein
LASLRKTEHPLRIGLLLDGDRQLGAWESLADAICQRGHATHLLVQGETVKDRDGALARLAPAHLGLSVGHAPQRQDRWSSLLREVLDRLEPVRTAQADEDDDDGGRRKGQVLPRLVIAALPADPDVATYLGQLDLDLLLAPPRADAWSGRLDYFLACRRLGLRTALLAPAGEAPPALAAALDVPVIAVGLDEAPDEALLEAIEQAALTSVQPRPASWGLEPVLEAELAMRALERWVEDQLGADVRHGVLVGLARRAVAALQNAYARFVFPNVMRGLLALLPRQRELYRDLLNEQLDAGEMDRLGWAEDAIMAAQRGGAPILIGPWTGGVGHELLYWIPMLRWFRKYYSIDKARVVVISRGGVKDWYTGVLGNYLDLFDLVPLKRQEYRDDVLRRIASSEAPPAAGKIEKEIFKEAARLIGAERFTTLHPQVMFKLFKRRWSGLAGDTFVIRYTRLQSIGREVAPATKRLGELPRDYVAVDFRFSQALPDTPRNRDLILRFVQRLSQDVDVFLLEPAIEPERGPLAGIGSGPRLHRIEKEIRPSEILAVQAGVIAGARAYVGTFGPMSYLGQALGCPTIAVKAADGPASSGERELQMIRPDPDAAPLHVIALEQLEALIPGLGGGKGRSSVLEEVLAAATAPVPAGREGRVRAAAGGVDG